MPFRFSLFQDLRDTQPTEAILDWSEICYRIEHPHKRARKDGRLFSPAVFDPPRRRNENVSELSLLILDFDHEINYEEIINYQRRLNCASAVHSTHRHLRITDKNLNAEPRFRLIVPLLLPIPAEKFPLLWRWAARRHGVVADEQAKDPAHMFYPPMKADSGALYEYHIEDGSFLDWRTLDFSEAPPAEKNDSQMDSEHGIYIGTGFTWYEDRDAEFIRRIKARGKLNSRGNYDARCLAHDGTGSTSLVLFSATGKVYCNKKCPPDALLRAEGLPDAFLPSRMREAALTKAANAPLRIVRMADVKHEDVSWLFFPYIAKRKLTLLEGEEGIGKSWSACAFASAVSRGHGLHGGEPCSAPGNVLMMSAEDGLGDTVRPRLEAMGADLTRVLAVEEAFTFDEVGLQRLENGIIEHRPTFVIVDPLFAYTGGKMDMNSANQSRKISAALAAIAERNICAILLVRHIGKSKGNGDPRNAGLGSIDWRAAARSVLLAGFDREKNERGIVQTKNNLATIGEPVGYALENGTFSWRDSCSVTAEHILAPIANDEESRAGSNAICVLRDILSDGQKSAREVQQEMRDAGFTENQTRYARQRLGVLTQKVGGHFGGERQGWFLSLPDAEGDNQPAEDVPVESLSHLQASTCGKSTSQKSLAEDANDPGLYRLQPEDIRIGPHTTDIEIDQICGRGLKSKLFE